jgi:hypothetical protein
MYVIFETFKLFESQIPHSVYTTLTELHIILKNEDFFSQNLLYELQEINDKVIFPPSLIPYKVNE